MTSQTPCQPNPEDWFIEKDGKQYRDDEFLTPAERRGLTKAVLRITGETEEEHEERVSKAIAHAEGDRKRAALRDRRHAREACYGCPVRLRCLGLGMLPEHIEHGIWGGYYSEEREQIQALLDARAATEGE